MAKRKKVMALIADLQHQVAHLKAWDAVLEARIKAREQVATNMREREKALDRMLKNADLLKVDELLKKVNWMHDRIDLLANRVDQIRGRLPNAVKSGGLAELLGAVHVDLEKRLRAPKAKRAKKAA